MELTKQLELLKQLCEIDGVSGGEEKVADWLKTICRRIARCALMHWAT